MACHASGATGSPRNLVTYHGAAVSHHRYNAATSGGAERGKTVA